MDLLDRVSGHFSASIELKIQAMPRLVPSTVKAGRLLVTCLQQKRKILSCGNGGSADQAQHFAAELINRFEKERPGLSAIALTTDTSALTSIANDSMFEQIFARQVQALGQLGDVLLALTTSGDSPNILKAIEMAHQQRMLVVLLNGRNGGQAAQLLKENDIEIRVPSKSTARIQEVHLLIIHCLCDIIDELLIATESKV